MIMPSGAGLNPRCAWLLLCSKKNFFLDVIIIFINCKHIIHCTMYLKTKRGMSPVIATITLIVLALVFGAVVMTWSGEGTTGDLSSPGTVPVECLPYVQSSCDYLGVGNVMAEQYDEES